MNVLLIGHSCGPELGSEPGNTWNWAQELSKTNRVWVIAYPEHRARVAAHLERYPNPNLEFVWVLRGHRFDRWKPGKGERGIRIHYVFWLAEAYRRAEELCSSIAIDIVHHVSWGTAGAPPPLWRIPVPVLWGPVGGGQATPKAYLRLFGRQRWMETARNARIRVLRFSRNLRRAAQQAGVVFATNEETAKLLKQVGAPRVEFLLDCGLPVAMVPANEPERMSTALFTVLWAGRLEHRKGLALVLQALARQPQLPMRLLVAGSGPQENEFRALSERLAVNGRVHFLGAVPYSEMAGLFRSSSAFLFSSLRDSFGSVVLEAMAYGLPVVTLDHQGVGTFVPAAAGIKIPVSTPDQTIGLLADALHVLCHSPESRTSMGRAAWMFAREQTWDRRAKRMIEIYENLLERAKKAA